MLCLSFYEWRCIDAGEQIILAPFLGKTNRNRAPWRFADFLFAPKHEKADVLLTTNMGPVRCPPPQVSQQVGSLLKPRQKAGQDCPLGVRVAVKGRKKRRVCMCNIRRAIRCKTKFDASRPPAPTAAVHTARHKQYTATPGIPDTTRTRKHAHIGNEEGRGFTWTSQA